MVLGEIGLEASEGAEHSFDSVLVTSRGEPVFADDFEWLDRTLSGQWQSASEWIPMGGWDLQGKWAMHDMLYWLGPPHTAALSLYHSGKPGRARIVNPNWIDMRLECDIYFDWAIVDGVNLHIGGDTGSRLTLSTDGATQEMVLRWEFVPPEGSELLPREEAYRDTCPFLNQPPYRLSLEAVDGRIRAAVRRPVAWWRLLDEGMQQEASYTTLAAIGDQLLMTIDEQAYSVTPTEGIVAMSPLDNWASETRAWQWPGERAWWVGTCQPEARRLQLGQVPAGMAGQWRQFLRNGLGPYLGSEVGMLGYPLSFAAAPDGRLYVLDAAESRLLAFDKNLRYLTQWGNKGSRDGEFDFGRGTIRAKGLDFSGSICVDDDGFIYVADPGNQRIQKFAP